MSSLIYNSINVVNECTSKTSKYRCFVDKQKRTKNQELAPILLMPFFLMNCGECKNG